MIATDKYKLWWDEENRLGRAEAYGEWDEAAAQEMNKEYIRISEKHGKADWLIDLKRLKKITPAARKALVESTSHPAVGKNAFVGASIYIKVIANFILAASGKTDSKHFLSIQEALAWLLKERE